MKTKIYLDNASTTYPKPPCVPDAVYQYMTQILKKQENNLFFFVIFR